MKNRIGAGRFWPLNAGFVTAEFSRIIFLVTLGTACGCLGAEESAEKLPRDLSELSLEALMDIELPMVYGASKFEQKVTAAPSSITVINAEEIKRYGYRTVAEILQNVQGFHVSYDRNYAFLGSRGVNLGDFNSRILLLINGHRLNNNLTDGALIDTAFALDVDLIDRIEIIRGAGSVLYGNNAFFGVINVITREGKQLNGAEVSGGYGSYDAYKARATYGKLFGNGVEILFSGSYFDSAGRNRLYYPEFDTPEQNNGVARGLDADMSGSVFGSVSFKGLTWESAFISREKENPTAQFFTAFNQPGLETVDRRGYTALRYEHSFEDVVDVSARLYYDRSDFQIGYPTVSILGTNLFKEEQVGEWWGAELQFNKRLWEKHMVGVGAEYRDDFRQDRLLYDRDSREVFTDASRNRQSHGVYVQGDFAVCTNLHVSGGVRYDKYGDFDATFNPRVAVIYNPVAGSTLKAIYGTAFRAPNFLELSHPDFQEIKPEEITSYELIYEQEITRSLRSSVSGFFNQMDDLIAFQSGSFTNFNADAKGVELALEGAWTNGIRTRVSYTLQQTEDRETRRRLVDSPNHLIKCSVSVPLIREKLFAGLDFQYTSGRRTLFTTTSGITESGTDATGFGVVNFTLFSQNLVKNLDASV
ncbi:MAG: TonB-dependent receptor, partial [Akkermansiaceae bacterium]|nr:TonB-dependent receptor [Verrucomicrobiales bacterium]